MIGSTPTRTGAAQQNDNARPTHNRPSAKAYAEVAAHPVHRLAPEKALVDGSRGEDAPPLGAALLQVEPGRWVGHLAEDVGQLLGFHQQRLRKKPVKEVLVLRKGSTRASITKEGGCETREAVGGGDHGAS